MKPQWVDPRDSPFGVTKVREQVEEERPAGQKRKPQWLDPRDTRFATTKERVIYCDSCHKPQGWQGQSVPHWGQYVNRNWPNAVQEQDRVTLQELEAGYKRGEYDVTWHCVPCIAGSMKVDHACVARVWNVFAKQEHRKKQMERLETFCRRGRPPHQR